MPTYASADDIQIFINPPNTAPADAAMVVFRGPTVDDIKLIRWEQAPSPVAAAALAWWTTDGDWESADPITVVTETANKSVKWNTDAGTGGWGSPAFFVDDGVGKFYDQVASSFDVLNSGLVIHSQKHDPAGSEGLLNFDTKTDLLNIYSGGAWRTVA